jgi:hypothetical protein
MNATQLARYERLRYHATRYEAIAESPDGARYLLGYTRNPGQRALLALTRQHGGALVKRFALTDNDPPPTHKGSKTSARWDFGKFAVRFGRTERDALREGEHGNP